MVEVEVLMLGFFVEAAPPANSDPPGPVVVVVVVVVQFWLLSPTLAQLGSATAVTAETAITAANIAATVRSTIIRFTLIHPPFLYSFFLSRIPRCGGWASCERPT